MFAQRGELVTQFVPIVETILGHPEAEHFFRRHGRIAGQFQIIFPQVLQVRASHQVKSNLLSLHHNFPRLRLEIPILFVLIIEKQRVIIGGLPQNIGHWHLRIADRAAVPALHDIAVFARRPRPSGPIAVRGSGLDKLLP